MEHHTSVVFRGDAKRALDFAEGVLVARGFERAEGGGPRRVEHELAATHRARVAVRSTVETHVLLRALEGELDLNVRVLGVDALRRRLTRILVVSALVLFIVQGTAGSLLFKTPVRIQSVGMAAALVLFFAVLWFSSGPRLFQAWERGIVAELERLLHETAAVGERE